MFLMFLLGCRTDLFSSFIWKTSSFASSSYFLREIQRRNQHLAYHVRHHLTLFLLCDPVLRDWSNGLSTFRIFVIADTFRSSYSRLLSFSLPSPDLFLNVYELSIAILMDHPALPIYWTLLQLMLNFQFVC
jgi:hypothetical protein